MKAWIPDVSEHQGKINWEKLVGKIPGAIIRIGYGNDDKQQDDIYANYNMSECRRLGIPFAVYIYSYATNASEIRSEIQHTKRMCKWYEPVSYWLDLEQRDKTAIWRLAADLWKEEFGNKAGVYSWGWAFEKHVRSGRKWICAYGKNTGKPDRAYEPSLPGVDGWQFTSKAVLSGIRGYCDLSEWYVAPFATAKPIEIKPHRRVVTKKEVAALIMRHLCTHDKHGYTQDMQGRQGAGTETIDIYGKEYIIKSGDRDCSSAVISAYEAAGISCGGATYTGNMRKCMTGTGNFVWRSMKFIAQMGDTYLAHDEIKGNCHTAMCLSAEPDVLMEFSINEKGTALGGKTGDQKQKGEYDSAYGSGESHLAIYYDYPWNGILQCVNDEIAFVLEEDGSITYPTKDDGFTGEEKKMDIVSPEKSDTDLAVEVWFGVYGNEKSRRKALGGRFDSVQKEVGEISDIANFITASKSYLKKHGCKNLFEH